MGKKKLNGSNCNYRWESPNIDSSHLVPESFFSSLLKLFWLERNIRMEWKGNQKGVDSSVNWTRRCCFVVPKAEVRVTALTRPSRALSLAFVQTSWMLIIGLYYYTVQCKRNLLSVLLVNKSKFRLLLIKLEGFTLSWWQCYKVVLSLLRQNRRRGDTPSEWTGNRVFPVYKGEAQLGGKDTDTGRQSEEMAGSLSLIKSCRSSPAGGDCQSWVPERFSWSCRL